jgi:hypothetical protein
MDEEHPIQPIVRDSHGTVRFKENAIVRYLLDNGGIDMNKLATLPFCQNDREQFAQLIGYSLSGFGDLSYVSDRTYERAAMAWMATETSAAQPAEGE